MKRALTWLAGGVVALLALVAAALLLVDTGPGHRWVADRIAGVKTANGLRFAVGRIDGSLYGDARLSDVRVYDLDGLLFRAPAVRLDWSPLKWFSNTLDVERLEIGEAFLLRAPRTRRTGRQGPILPDFDIRIARPWSLVHTEEARPYCTPLAHSSACASSENFWTVMIGPKISVWICSSSWRSPESTVGS